MVKATPPTTPAQDLAISLRLGRHQALSTLFDKYAGVLLGIISRRVPDRVGAEEVLRKSFVLIWEQAGRYDPAKGNLLAWMMALARYVAAEGMPAASADKVAASPDALPEEMESPHPKPTQMQETKGGKSIQHLNARENAALDLVFLQGYSCVEAATTLQIPEATLKIALRQSINQLRAERKA